MKSDVQIAFELLQREVDALAAPQVTLETPLQALPQWDSLALLLVIQHAEIHYHRAVTGAQLRKCRHVSDLINLLLQK